MSATRCAALYLPFDRVKRAVAQDVRQLALLLAAALGVLWLALFRLVASASRRLPHQMTRNEHDALHDALTGLPNVPRRPGTSRRSSPTQAPVAVPFAGSTSTA